MSTFHKENPATHHYLYGDEGNDTIWGEDKTSYQYIWGGEGSDTIYGASMIAKQQVLYGNGGDDTIYPGSMNPDIETLNVGGGKGNDIINPVTFKDDGSGMGTLEFDNSAMANPLENFYGGEGDDTIWGGSGPTGPVVYKGGAGDDKLYGAY